MKGLSVLGEFRSPFASASSSSPPHALDDSPIQYGIDSSPLGVPKVCPFPFFFDFSLGIIFFFFLSFLFFSLGPKSNPFHFFMDL